MTEIKIDIDRLAVLRVVSDRERDALAAASERVEADIETASHLRREILALQRRESANRTPYDLEEVNRRQAARQAVEDRIATGEQTIEIQRERSRAANQLRLRCEAFAAKSQEAMR